MSAVFTPTRYKLTVEDFEKLGEAGVLNEDSRVELIEGELIEMAPIGGPHMGLVNRLNRMLVSAVGELGVVSIQNPVKLPPYSEPQPDIAILRPGADGASAAVPEAKDVLLLIEVADTTLAYDRGTKRGLYARAVIPEVWIVNVNAKLIEVYREPDGKDYVRRLEFGPGEVVSVQALPGVKLVVDEVFG